MKVSVYITSYNQQDFLGAAIESVLAQTLHPCQIIIVDDASKDHSKEIISGYVNRYPELISPIFHEENCGVARSRNDALKAVSGDWVAYIDGDDRLLPTKLETEVKISEKNPEAKIIYSNYYVIDVNGKRIDVWARKPMPQGYIFTQTIGLDFPKMRPFRDEMIHYPSLKNIGFYDCNLKVYEDWDIRIRLTKRLRVSYTGQILSEHRRQGTGLSKLDGAIYINAYRYIKNKNLHLLDDLNTNEKEYVSNKMDQFHAYLIRRMGRQALSSKDNFFSQRMNAWMFYRESLKVKRKLDIPFWLDFILSPKGYQRLKSIYTEWNNRQLGHM